LWKTGVRRKERKKGPKKERKRALWKRTPLMEIRLQRGFPQRLGKHKALSTVPHKADDGGPITRFKKRGHFKRGKEGDILKEL
jgi:hypothetical protein